MTEQTYSIIRWFEDDPHKYRKIKSGLTLEQAREHCDDPETSSQTCTGYAKKKYTEQHGHWFDTMRKE